MTFETSTAARAGTAAADRRRDGAAPHEPAPAPPGAPARSRTRAGRVVALVAGTALVGGACGLALAVARPPSPAATVRFAVLADPVLPGDSSSGSSTSDSDRFVQTQLLVLGGADLRQEVARQVHAAQPPRVQAVQVGGTDVVEVTVTGPSAGQATRAAGQLLRTYSRHRDQAFASRAGILGTALDSQLKTVQGSLSGPAPGAKGAPDQSALVSSSATEYARLLASSNDLGLVSAADRTFTTVVQSPAPVPRSTPVLLVRDALLGLLAGLVAGLAVVVLPRWARSV